MKTIGLIGGMSWPSTVEYYTIINKAVGERLGAAYSAEIVLYSFDFGVLRALIVQNNWHRIGELMAQAASRIEKAGAQCVMLCANTPHKVAHHIRESSSLPLIHIAEETAKVMARSGIKRAALLGTRFTMEEPFYADALATVGIEKIVPGADDRLFINSVIFNELTRNIFTPATKSRLMEIIQRLERDDAEGIIMGCTEIPLMITADDCRLPMFNTTEIHALAAVEFALS